MKYTDVSVITNSLLFINIPELQGVERPAYDEAVIIELDDGSSRYGRIVRIDDITIAIQVFDGTFDMSLKNVGIVLTGKPLEFGLSPEILGRVFDGLGRPCDGMGNIKANIFKNINGLPINPVSREYPKNYISTGFSSIDTLTTLIRGQKLPVFSGSGMRHNELAAQIVRQASVADGSEFCIVFAAMGVNHDVAEYFRTSFETSGVSDRVTMFLNLTGDPVTERILIPRFALTAAEYLAFDLGKNVLVIMSDMTSYAEALREFSSSKEEIPAKKGYPGYLYSDLASLYERAGIIKGKPGSVTQIPILTMPNDDITHPVPDLTGFITEGQIVLDRTLEASGIYPAVSILPSLSRLMKDGIGAEYTTDYHPKLANQLFSSYSKVQDAKSLASVIGEDELSETDKKLLQFGREFENKFINQHEGESRTLEQSLQLGWELLKILPESELDRLESDLIEKYIYEQ
ncbi:V-type ATP synthase subunit B [Eubacteriales bacterium OttesenSCG-928-G02]|nr:V-type ATP synthase subunit B [Eubacteriales bacterium OttesenSCG-928-G02]